MPKSGFTIACIVKDPQNRFFSDSGWDKKMDRASIFTLIQAAKKITELKREKDLAATLRCVIQNKNFDYYDGKSWAYNLSGAKLYSHEEAVMTVSRLK